MAKYVTASDSLVALNGTIPFNSVSISCGTGNVVPISPGVLTLKGNTPNRFARYDVTLQANVAVPEGGAVTPIALGISLNGSVLPDSEAIFTPQAVEEYGFINVRTTVTIPCGCCATISATYVDGTEDDPAVTPTPSIEVRRNASISVERTA